MDMRIVAARPTRIALAVVGVFAVLLLAAQFLLPGIAARIARDQLAKYGSVRSVSVRAFPAIELLWGRAESASVRAGDLRMSVSQLDGLLPRARGIERMEMSAESLQVGAIKLRDVRTSKRGGEILTQATLDRSDLQSVLPAGVQAQLVGSADGAAEVRVSGSLFGVGASMLAQLSAQEGKLVAQPQGIPFAGLTRITLFSDPRFYFESVDLAPRGDAAGESYALTLRAKLL